MYDYIIIHGSYGSPFENWFPWLYKKLSEAQKNVLVPQMPCGENIQDYDNWKKVLDAYKHLINEDTVFIGHSLSPAFIADYIIENKIFVKKVVFAAPFYGLINIPDFDKVNSPFFIRNDLNLLGKFAHERICFISKTDPYVPNSLSFEFAEEIKAKTILVENAGHFNENAGYKEFPALLDFLK